MSSSPGLPTVLVIDPDPLWRGGVVSSLGENAATMQYGSLVDAFVAVPNLDPEVFVLGPGLSDELEEIGPLTRANPHLAVVAVVDNPTVDVLQQAVRNGVHDVVSDRREDVVARSALESVDWSRARRGAAAVPRRHRSPAIIVCSAKGGVGTTSVAINLAVLLTRNHDQVAIADADPVFGDVAMFLGMPAPPPAPEGENPPQRISAEELMTLVARHKRTGLTVFSPRQSHVPLSDLPKDLIGHVLSGLQQLTNVVVADVPAPLTNAMHLLPFADRVVLVAEHTPNSLKNTLVARKLLQHHGIADAVVDIVLNNVPRPAEVARYDLEQLFGTPVIGVLPETPHMTQAIEQQLPLAKASPRDPWVAELARVAERLSGVPSVAG
jgi:MinD-like ATPase involved in chromosome partitioning or flagellar assembly